MTKLKQKTKIKEAQGKFSMLRPHEFKVLKVENLSLDNLKQIEKVVRIVSNKMEFQNKGDKDIVIEIKKFSDVGVSSSDAEEIIGMLNREIELQIFSDRFFSPSVFINEGYKDEKYLQILGINYPQDYYRTWSQFKEALGGIIRSKEPKPETSQKQKKSVEGKQSQTKKIEKKKIMKPPTFDKNMGKLKYGDKEILTPYGKKEWCFYKIMFDKEKSKEELVSWDEIWSEIAGEEDISRGEGRKKEIRTIYDTYLRANKRAKKIGIKKLFEWKDTNIRRLL